MISKISICNMALLSLGTRAIASLDERTPEAVYCAHHYALALEELLREHPWNFAQRREALAEVPLPESWAREYPRAYAYPADCLHLHTLINEAGARSQDFTVATHAGRTLVLSAIDLPVAAYTTLMSESAHFDPLFAKALAAKLACNLAPSILKGNGQALQLAAKNYAEAMERAKTADAREGKPYAEPEGEWNGGHDNPWIAARMNCYRR